MSKDHRYLVATPPIEPKLISGLFVNREGELEVATETLKSIIKNGTSQIICIPGPARIGKSHFSRLLVKEIKSSQNLVKEYTAGNPLDTLRYLALHADKDFNNKAIKKKNVFDNPLFSSYNAFTADVTPLIEGNAEILTNHTSKRSLQEMNDFFLRIPVPRAIETGIRSTLSALEEESRSESIKIGPANIYTLTGIIQTIAETAVATGVYKRFILFFDDFDLFEHREQRDRFFECMKDLSKSPAIIVITTLRTDFFNNHRQDFYPLAQLGAMSKEDLIRVYYQHNRFFQVRDTFIEEPALMSIAQKANGRPGYFLDMLFQLYEKFRIKKKNKAYNVRDIDSFLSDEVEQFETQAPDGMNIIKNYIKERRPKISQEDSLTLRETLLFGKIAHVSYSENRSLEINPIYFDHMLEVLK
jgi:hypothetical protein